VGRDSETQTGVNDVFYKNKHLITVSGIFLQFEVKVLNHRQTIPFSATDKTFVLQNKTTPLCISFEKL